MLAIPIQCLCLLKLQRCRQRPVLPYLFAGSEPEIQSEQISGLENSGLMARDKLLESFVVSTGAEGSQGVLAPGPLIEGEQNREFLNKWKEIHGGLPPSAYHAQAFDAAYLLLNSIKSSSIEERLRWGLLSDCREYVISSMVSRVTTASLAH